MSRQVRTLVILLAVVVVLAGALVFVQLSPKFKGSGASSSSEAATINLIKTDASKIKTLQVTNRKGAYTITGGKSYTISANLGSAPVNPTSLQTAAGDAAALTATSVAAKNVKSLAPYGLQNPQATVNVTTTDGHSYSYLIGDQSAMGDGYYIAAKGSTTVYITSSEVETYFLASPWTFIDTSLLTLDATKDVPNLTNISFGGSKRGEPLSINIPATTADSSSVSNYTADATPYFAPSRLLANTTQISTLEQDLAALSASSVASLDVSAASLQKYGLKNPAYTFSCTVKGKTTTLLFGNEAAASSSDDTSSGTTNLYVMKQGVPVVYVISSASVPFYSWSKADLMDPLQFIIAITDLKSMTVQTPQQTYAFAFTGSGDSQTVSYNGKKLDMSNFRNYYQNVISTSFTGLVSKPGNPKLYAKVTCTYKDAAKGSKSMTFYALDDQRCYWEVGSNGGMYVLKATVDKLISETQKVSVGQTVTAQ